MVFTVIRVTDAIFIGHDLAKPCIIWVEKFNPSNRRVGKHEKKIKPELSEGQKDPCPLQDVAVNVA